MCPADPVGLPRRPTGDEGIDGSGGSGVHQACEEFQRGRVTPVHIFEDEHQRLAAGHGGQQRQEGRQHLLPLVLWVQERHVVGLVRQIAPEQEGEPRDRRGRRQPVLVHHLLQSGALRCGRRVRVPLQEALECGRERRPGCVLVIGGTAPFQTGMRFLRHLCLERGH